MRTSLIRQAARKNAPPHGTPGTLTLGLAHLDTNAMPREGAKSAPGLSAASDVAATQPRASRSGGPLIPVAVIALEAAVRRRLGRLIDAADGVRLAGSFASIEAAEGELNGYKIPVVLLGEDGRLFPRALIRKLTFLAPAVPPVLHSPLPCPLSIFSALVAGASGYVLNSAPPGQFTQAVLEASQRRVFLCRLAEWEAREHLRTLYQHPDRDSLTERQEQVCIWLASSRCQEKDIAWGLNLSAKTVHTHTEAIYKKLGVHGRKGLHALLTAHPR